MDTTFHGDGVQLEGRWYEPVAEARGLAVLAHRTC